MPARWESSQRPLFVRTVWVDGSRHAILSPEDPLLVQCPPLALAPRSDSRGNSSDVSSSEVSSCDELAHCLIKLQLVLGSNGNHRRKSARRDRQPRSEARPKTTHAVKCREASEYAGDKESRRASVASAAANMFARYKRPFVPEIFHSSSEEEPDEDDDDMDAWMLRGVEALLPELSSNPLSERVLQWLDLAGKTSEEVSPCPPRPQRASRRSVLSSAPGKTSVPRRPRPIPATERRFSFPARTVAPESSSSSQEPLSVNARGMKTRRKRASLADDNGSDEAWSREMARLAAVRAATPPPEETTTAQPALRATTCVDRGRTQLHIFMPSLPREGGGRARHRGDGDNGSESGTQWSEL